MNRFCETWYFFLVLIAGILFINSSSLWALSAAMGIAGVEEGDDRLRPASIFVVREQDWALGLGRYGRKLGSSKETTSVMSISRYFGFVAGADAEDKAMGFAHTGVSFLLEQAHYVSLDEDQESSDEENSFNLGAVLGVGYRVMAHRHFFIQLHWDAHLYLAGAAGILLVTGRKQFVGVSMGVSF